MTGDQTAPAIVRAAQDFGLPTRSSDLPVRPAGAAVLVRPDRFVGWVGNDADDLRAYLTAILGPTVLTMTSR